MKPLVSVMMPAFNAGAFIAAAIKSMQAQTYENWQLCIVDDGSQDLTFELARNMSHHDARICVERHHANLGCPSARNTCLKMADGDIIAKLDADDLHEPERLEAQVGMLLAEEVQLVTCEMTWLKGKIKMPRKVGPMIPKLYLTGKSNGPVCASIVAWKRVYDAAGSFKVDQLAGSDGDWNFRVVDAGFKWGHIPKHWYHQRRHPGQLSRRMHGMQRKVHEEARARANRKRQRNDQSI